jgi:hypothetical protein
MKPPKRWKRILWASSVLLFSFGPLLTTTSAQGYLYSQSALGVGNNPSSIALADLNGDGILNFAVTNQNDNPLRCFWVDRTEPMLPKLTTKPATRRWRSSAQITGNFTEPDNCAGPLAVGHGCTANVSFTPKANGASNGSISFSDSFAPRTQVLPVTGWAGPPDFSMSLDPNSSSINAGNTATSLLTLNSGGGFSGTVQLPCSGAPSKATCTVAKSSVTLDGSAAVTVNVAVTTTTPSVAAFTSPDSYSFPEFPFAAFCVVGLGTAAMLLLARRRRIAAMVGAVVLILMISSRGGGGHRSRRRRNDSRYATWNLQCDGFRNQRKPHAYQHDCLDRELAATFPDNMIW